MSYAPLLVKSAHSPSGGSARIPALVERARSLGCPSVALADTGSVAGQVAFHHAARAAGLRPVTGVELELELPAAECPGNSAPRGRVILLARDHRGYEALCRLVTIAHLGCDAAGLRRRAAEEAEHPDRRSAAGLPARKVSPLAPEALAGSDGLYILTPHAAALCALARTPGLDRGSLRALILDPAPDPAARGTARAAAELAIPVVAGPEIAYLEPADAVLHRLRQAISTRTLLARGALEGPSRLHFPAPHEVAARFARLDAALRAARELAESCELDLRDWAPSFPRPARPRGDCPIAELASRRSASGSSR